MNGKLYVVGTPIGNLADFSPRARQTLSDVDFIAAEDTRVTLKLLNHFEIKKELISYHEYNKREKGEEICSRIEAGESCAIVTDAGMPCISDPGEDLVRLCHSRGIAVSCVPGPTALASALALSGLKTGRFAFEGFLSVAKKSRYSHLEEIKTEKRTIIFYESPHKLAKTLEDLYDFLGNRQCAIVHEITKIHEEVISTTLGAARALYPADKALKGEFVIVISGAEPAQENEITFEDVFAKAQRLVESGVSINDAAKQSAHGTQFKKSDIYKRLLES
ncbi:MAG: 16S rRNA (cytidine(1402)-2'-O)-methyltransferase [Clostridiales bacterium]|nr:16S rRNA (cytidine(1402)-2'-O)-methyltransferase [Clostridiales bacterium]